MARILLVDDDAGGLSIRQLVLERHGHVVATASEVTAALEAFRNFHPEVVVADLRLPDLDAGLGLIRELRAAGPESKIIILTGNPGDLDGRPELALVDQVLGKPARSEILLNAIT